MELEDAVLAGKPHAVARALTLVEARLPSHRELLERLLPRIGHAHRIGLTGAPGVGKSSLAAALVAAARARGRSVAVLAIDPSSSFTGGALLGDRIRLHEHSGDPGVFVRSMASRGASGGLSAAAGDALDVLDAAGFDIIILETVGAGQVDIDVAREVMTTIVLLAPGGGDDIQAMKSGLLEIAHVWVVNKADLAGAEQTRNDLVQALSLRPASEFDPGRVFLVASTSREGVPELLDALEARHLELLADGSGRRLRENRVAWRIESTARESVATAMREMPERLRELAELVLSGQRTIELAAADLLQSVVARESAGGAA